MRTLLYILMFSSLLLLPFSGMAGAVHAPSAAVSEQPPEPHCELMAKAQAAQHNESSVEQANTLSNAHACCDANSCGMSCPADCGSCVLSGHGFSAFLAHDMRLPSHLAEPPLVFLVMQYRSYTAPPPAPPVIA